MKKQKVYVMGTALIFCLMFTGCDTLVEDLGKELAGELLKSLTSSEEELTEEELTGKEGSLEELREKEDESEELAEKEDSSEALREKEDGSEELTGKEDDPDVNETAKNDKREAAGKEKPQASTSQSQSSEEKKSNVQDLTISKIADILGQSNLFLKQIYSSPDQSEIIRSQLYAGGTPVVSYHNPDDTAWMVIWLDGSYESAIDAFNSAERASNQDMPAYNCFPDNFIISRVFFPEDEGFLEGLFDTENPDPAMITKLLGTEPEVEYKPADPEFTMDGYDVDITIYTYHLPDYSFSMGVDNDGKIYYGELFR